MKKEILLDIRDLDRLIRETVSNGKDPRRQINMTQMQIIVYLSENENVCQKDLEKQTRLKKASITGALNSLELKGIIERRSCPEDRRRNIIVLTEKMEKIRGLIDRRTDEVADIAFKDISDKEIAQFKKTLLKISDNLKEAKK